MYTFKKYGKYWAVWHDERLICVTVYKCGAVAVIKELRKEGA